MPSFVTQRFVVWTQDWVVRARTPTTVARARIVDYFGKFNKRGESSLSPPVCTRVAPPEEAYAGGGVAVGSV